MDRISALKKKRKDLSDMRRRRCETTVELRKNNREALIMKRRNVSNEGNEFDDLLPNVMGAQQLALAAADASKPEEQLAAVKTTRLLVSLEQPPIETLIKFGFVEILVACIRPENSSMLQFEATWTLTNIASGTAEQTQRVVSSGAVPLLVNLLSSPDHHVAKQAVWALGNIIGDGPPMRDVVLGHGFIEPFVRLMKSSDISAGFMLNITWVIGNMSRKIEPIMEDQAVIDIMPGIKAMLEHSDTDVVAETVSAINSLCMCGSNRIQIVINSGVVPKVVSLLDSNDLAVLLAAVNTAGNVAAGNDEQTQLVLDCGALSYFPALLLHPSMRLRRESLWFLSNITAGTESQVQKVLDSGLISQIIESLWNGDHQTQHEAACTIGNVCICGTRKQVVDIINDRVIPPLCNLLVNNDAELVRTVLEGLKNMLEMSAPNEVEVANLIEECGGLDKIEQLQSHQNGDIYKLAFEIIEAYFSDGDDLQSSHLTEFNFEPHTDKPSGNSFTF